MSLTLIITLTINICESANAEIARPLSSNHPRYARSLLATFPLFLQHSQTAQVVAVDVDLAATTNRLYQLAAEQFGVDIDSVQLRLGGVLIKNTHTPLADWSDGESALGISAEAQIEVAIHQRNDISQLLDMIDDDAKSRFFSETELQRIHELNEQAMQSPDGDISEVVKFIRSRRSSGRAHISRIRTHVDEQRGRARHRINDLTFSRLFDNLRWQHLPKQTEILQLHGGLVTAIDFNGIECNNLRTLFVTQTELVHLELSGLEKCTMLEDVRIHSNFNLKRLSIAPLEHCGNLKWLNLQGNALEDLDLSPLSRASSLRTVRIGGNPFTRDVEEIKEPLHTLTDYKLMWGW